MKTRREYIAAIEELGGKARSKATLSELVETHADLLETSQESEPEATVDAVEAEPEKPETSARPWPMPANLAGRNL